MPKARLASILSLGAILVLVSLSGAGAADFDDGPALYKAIDKEIGPARGKYLGRGGLVSDQIGMALGHPWPTRQLADGNYLVSGCRPHDCPEKGAVVATPTGAVLAAGLINFPCAMDRKVAGIVCKKYDTAPPVLTVFLRKKNNRPAILRDLKDWADGAQLADRKANPGEPILHIATTEIRIIPEPGSK